MNWSNYHAHSDFCHGKGTLEDYIKASLASGMKSIGFSSHAPLPFETSWAMPEDQFTNYLNEITALRKKYKKKIQLYAGLELDYIPGLVGPADESTIQLSLDYTVGSVHFIDQFPDGTHFEADGSRRIFINGINQIFFGDVKILVKRYFELVREMLIKSKPTILGHLDKIKMHNHASIIFSENESWYREEILHTLDVLAASKVILEVNTRGLYKKKCDETYPSSWVLKEALKNNIPITVSSDAHHPREVAGYFESAISMLREIGYRHIHQLWNGIWEANEL